MTTALVLDGELTIATVAARCAEVLAAARAHQPLDLRGLTELDLAGLQLLLFARREAGTLELRVGEVAARLLALVHLDASLEARHD